jgi:hypothetical protein
MIENVRIYFQSPPYNKEENNFFYWRVLIYWGRV